jgi:hypothetical protein
MFTTIEPRLIALLNTDSASELLPSSTSPSLELPPLHDPNILKASGRPLLLEPDASKRNGKPSGNAQLVSQHAALILNIDEEESKTQKSAKSVGDRTLGNSSPQSLRKILDGSNEDSVASASKKRNIIPSSKDDFVQLPQPPKKQKATQQVVPPIIIGLFEPPPQAALFPPIASSSFHDSHGRNTLNTVPLKVNELDRSRQDDSPSPIVRKKKKDKGKRPRDVKVRRKWTEEETNKLLLGVSKHGLGRWTDILEDPSFSFNGRSGVDLKDRFRTCCPAELRGKSPKDPNLKADDQGMENGTSKNPRKNKSSPFTGNILVEADFSFSKSRRSRAHRKKLEDLVQLGIEGPFRKSGRRERKSFSGQDDHEILMGYEIYGPAWTRIQRDPRFHLQSRQPIDLRDRFRNKYPEKFRSDELKDSRHIARQAQKIDKSEKKNISSSQRPSLVQSSSSREGLRIQQIISSEPEVDKLTSKALSAQPQILNYGFGSFPDQAVEPTDGLPFTQPFDWGSGNMTAPFSGNIGEMEISRLLLDESWIDCAVKEKPSFTDINRIISSNSHSLPQVPSFLNMLVSDEQMNLPASDTSFG